MRRRLSSRSRAPGGHRTRRPAAHDPRRAHVHPRRSTDPGPGRRSPRSRTGLRSALRGRGTAAGHLRQALQRGPRAHQPPRPHVERVQHLHAVGQRRAFAGQLRLRHRSLRAGTRCVAGAHRARCGGAAAVRAAVPVRVHGLQDRCALPRDEPDLLRRARGAAARGGARDRGHCVVRDPDLPGVRGAAGHAHRPGAVPRGAGRQQRSGAVHPGLDQLRGPVDHPGGHRLLRHGDDPTVRGVRRAHHPW